MKNEEIAINIPETHDEGAQNEDRKRMLQNFHTQNQSLMKL